MNASVHRTVVQRVSVVWRRGGKVSHTLPLFWILLPAFSFFILLFNCTIKIKQQNSRFGWRVDQSWTNLTDLMVETTNRTEVCGSVRDSLCFNHLIAQRSESSLHNKNRTSKFHYDFMFLRVWSFSSSPLTLSFEPVGFCWVCKYFKFASQNHYFLKQLLTLDFTQQTKGNTTFLVQYFPSTSALLPNEGIMAVHH